MKVRAINNQEVNEFERKNVTRPGLEPELSEPESDVLPLYYRAILNCDLAETRTLDPLIKSQLLYQLSYEVVQTGVQFST